MPAADRSLSVSWQDPRMLADAARSMSGIDFLRAIRDGRLPPPPIAVLLDFKLTEVEPGHAVFEVVPGEKHYNPIGKVVHLGKRMATAEGRLEDAAGRLYAHATTTCLLLEGH